MLRIYFGHPINTYGTELEAMLMAKLYEAFSGWEIENPNQGHHQEGYRDWKSRHGNGMDYYYKEVLPHCHSGVFLPFRDGAWGAGILGEAKFLINSGRPIFRITPDGTITRIGNLNTVPVLTIEETRRRIRTDSGETVPY